MPTPEHMLPSVESADTGPDAGPDTQVGGLHLAEIAAQFSGLLVSTPFDPVWGHASQNNANRDAELEPALLLDHAGFAVVRPAPELACVRCVARHALDNTVDPSGHVVAKHVRKTGFVYPFGTASLGLVPVLLKAIDVGHLARVDVRAGTVTYAPILVHPTCSCAMAPEPGPLEPVVTGPDLRAGEPAAPEPSAYASLVHKERLTFDPAGSITCLTHSYRSSGRVEDVCGGRALSVAAAKRSARCEAVERHHVVHVTRPLHRASFAALAEPALDPEALHVHRPFAPAGSPQYHADLPLRWTAGWSLTHDRKTWVPAQEVWFEALALPDEPALVQPTTSGCAVGSSLTEAVLHALIELIERDAFLAAWYARRPVREIPISALDDAGFQALLQRAQAAHPAHTFRFLDVTSEVGLPAVWAQAVGPHGDGLRTLNATAAGFSTAAACRSALRELIGFFGARFTFAQRRAEAEAGLADPFQIHTIEDHGAVAALDAAFERFAFTYEDPTPAPVVDLLAGQTQIDLNGLIADLTRRLAGLGSEAVFVPLTLPGYAARGLHTARVLATELFPLTFGHQERRLAHRPRAASLNLSPTAPPHPLL